MRRPQPKLRAGLLTLPDGRLILQVCIAEFRCHMSTKAVYAMGHWIIVDTAVVAFVAITTTPAPGVNDDRATMAVVNGMQCALFAFLVLCVTCESVHLKRSFFVHFIFKRTVLFAFLGKYTYPFYLISQGTCELYLPWLMRISDPKSLPSFNLKNEGVLVHLFAMCLCLALAKFVQHSFQDTYVTRAFLATQQKLFGGGIQATFSDARSPIARSQWCQWCVPTTAAKGEEKDGRRKEE